MIIFACPHCKHKLQVQDQYAGKQARCLACKQTVPIPRPDTTVPWNPSENLADLAEAPTLGGEASNRSATGLKEEGPRFLLGDEIARGGMGAVLRATDRDLRREVAVKYLLDEKNADQKTQFVEEAQITGQLEHPNIVPIHELGIDGEGRLFFSMKMVRGRSLGQVLEELRKKPQEADKQYSLGKLLTILVSVCNALAYAHSRNVIHRDLKPANIMLGDFGEVYVMDWGIAKVLASLPHKRGEEEADEENESSPRLRPPFADTVTTGRQGGADLTQVGAIVGTPVYMPPEQASGNQDAISPRSDVYSLGATLYEILTLQPPVDRKGSSLEILMRVVDGEIVPPEQRCPERARRGLIPSELSAIAMKALATKPEDRYASVEEVRHDLERYMEGRSVSAKHDTFREAAWKFVKRNKLVSAFVTVLALVMLWSVWTNWQARRETDRAYQAYRDQVKQSAPAFVRSARLSLDRRDFDDALKQIRVAVESDGDNTEARLLLAHLLICEKEFAKGLAELERCQTANPGDRDVEELAALCRKADDDLSTLLVFARYFADHSQYALADRILSGHGTNAVAVRKQILELFRERIHKAWPGQVKKFTLSDQGTFELDLGNSSEVKDLTPLRGIPLTVLKLGPNVLLRDLTPLAGMPLKELNLGGCTEVRDLKPLSGMALTTLILSGASRVDDLSPLTGMPLRVLDMQACRLVRDFSPLRGMPLKELNLGHCDPVDLTDLKGLPLTTLNLNRCLRVRDLSPLHGMKLVSLILSQTEVSDVSPLEGMPLVSLDLHSCKQLKDVSPLRGMRLTTLILGRCPVRDLSPLRGMPLTSLNVGECREIRDLSPLRGMALTEIHIVLTAVSDLSPLEGMMLEAISLTPKADLKGMEVLRKMPSLMRVALAGGSSLSAEEFWKKYDGGGFNK